MSKKNHVKLSRKTLESLSEPRLTNVRKEAMLMVRLADPDYNYACDNHNEEIIARIKEAKEYATLVCSIYALKYGEYRHRQSDR